MLASPAWRLKRYACAAALQGLCSSVCSRHGMGSQASIGCFQAATVAIACSAHTRTMVSKW
jgi:hypothetical protein